MGKRRGVCRVLVGKHEGKRPPGRARRRWEDSIKMEWDVGDVDWIELAHDRDCGNEPSVSIKCWVFLDKLRNS
jgi:hypothetical protein